tara:strand:+ start:231 stop:746 length:516 start_codon:yes stop_codon:yes gene_type:complete
MATKIVNNITFYQIPDFAKYFISKCGKIYSEQSDKILKDRIHNGYLQLKLCKDGKSYNKVIHRLVALTFIPNPKNKPCIDHKNRIRTDNRLENLHWVTKKENNQNVSKKATTLWQGVSYDESTNRFRAKWADENSKQCYKSFSYGVYGIFALLMAIDVREEMVKLLYNRSE